MTPTPEAGILSNVGYNRASNMISNTAEAPTFWRRIDRLSCGWLILNTVLVIRLQPWFTVAKPINLDFDARETTCFSVEIRCHKSTLVTDWLQLMTQSARSLFTIIRDFLDSNHIETKHDLIGSSLMLPLRLLGKVSLSVFLADWSR